MPTEVEAKYCAERHGPLLALATETRLGNAILGPARTSDEVDRYLDTRHGRLATALWACRLRERDGEVRVSLKGPALAGSKAWLHRRVEIEAPATDSFDPAHWPESEARAFLDELRGGEPLEERLQLRQQRTERPVLLHGAQLGTLSLDVVAIEGATAVGGELYVVELELAGDGEGDPAATRELARLADALARRPGLEPDPRTKLEHAMERLAAP